MEVVHQLHCALARPAGISQRRACLGMQFCFVPVRKQTIELVCRDQFAQFSLFVHQLRHATGRRFEDARVQAEVVAAIPGVDIQRCER